MFTVLHVHCGRKLGDDQPAAVGEGLGAAAQPYAEPRARASPRRGRP